jgi:hypothetical protein
MIMKVKFLTLALCCTVLMTALASCSASVEAPVGVGRDEVTGTETKDVMGTTAGTESNDGPESNDGQEQLPNHNGYASYSGSEAEGNLTYITHTGKVLKDFSKFDGLGRDFFSDTSDKTNGSWYCGVTVRDEATGKVTVKYDRAPDVFEAM